MQNFGPETVAVTVGTTDNPELIAVDELRESDTVLGNFAQDELEPGEKSVRSGKVVGSSV